MLLQERTPAPAFIAASKLAAVERHPLTVRILHWVNAIALSGLIATGFLIYIKHFERAALEIHIGCAIVFAAAGAGYLVEFVGSRRWSLLLPRASSWLDAVRVALHDLGVRHHVSRDGRYNGAQKIAYTLVLLMAFGQVITGFALYFRGAVAPLVDTLGGRAMVHREHLVLTLVIVAFIAVHVVQVIRSGRRAFQAISLG